MDISLVHFITISHLNIGAGLDCARQVRARLESFLSVIEDESSLDPNFGLVVPTGSRS